MRIHSAQMIAVMLCLILGSPSRVTAEAVPPIYEVRGYFWVTDVTLAVVAHSGSSAAPQCFVDFNMFRCYAQAGSSFTITPLREGYAFSPPSRSYFDISANQQGDMPGSYVGGYTVNGDFGLRGVTLDTHGTANCVVTDTFYSCPDIPLGRELILSPRLAGYQFLFAPTRLVVMGNEQRNFTARALLSELECRDGEDDDQDGFADDSDRDCGGRGGPGLAAVTAGPCENGRDDDGDGVVDLNDPDCASRIDLFEGDDYADRGCVVRDQRSEKRLIGQLVGSASRSLTTLAIRSDLPVRTRVLLFSDLNKQMRIVERLAHLAPNTFIECQTQEGFYCATQSIRSERRDARRALVAIRNVGRNIGANAAALGKYQAKVEKLGRAINALREETILECVRRW